MENWIDWIIFQEIFKKIYENHNEEVFLKDVVVFLRTAYENIDENHDVKILLDQYDISGDRMLTFNEFSVMSLNCSTPASFSNISASHGRPLFSRLEAGGRRGGRGHWRGRHEGALHRGGHSEEELVGAGRHSDPQGEQYFFFSKSPGFCVLSVWIIGYSSINLIDSSDPLCKLYNRGGWLCWVAA